MHKKTIILQSEEFYQRNRMYCGTVKKLALRKPYFVIKNETIWEKNLEKNIHILLFQMYVYVLLNPSAVHWNKHSTVYQLYCKKNFIC